jgi:short subunit dehydrogenase-like uncharacterized protein
MSESNHWLIYGANGYTGKLIAREAVRRGMRPILGGRSSEKVADLAAELGCHSMAFALDSVDLIARAISKFAVVAHCAGPFSATARPMMEACLRACVSYVDITGEIDVIEAGAERDGRAREAGITLMPAVGFDVVPSDCLAATVAEALPGANLLQLAFQGTGGWSPGTMKTMIENLPHGGRARIGGKITRVPVGWKTLEVPFRAGKQWCATIPWGDVASAYYTTAIPNIEVYTALPLARIRQLRRWRWLMPVTGLPPIQRFLKSRVERSVKGPNAQELAASRSSLWARATDRDGRSVEATLEAPGGYPLTVQTTIASVQKILEGFGPKGFSTPARAFGKDFILSIPGTEMRLGEPGATPAAIAT